MPRALLASFAVISVLASAASAQQPPTVRIRGTIESIEGPMLMIKTREGNDVKVKMTDDLSVIGIAKTQLSEIKPGNYIGVSGMPQPDGSQKALEVHIFPEQMRGTGEGHRPYAPVPNSTMINGTASGATVVSTDGSTMLVKYKDGEKKIIVPPNTPIVRYEIGSKADLKPGAAFRVLAATKKPDGTLEAARINVGRDGTVPQ
jgi:hypothetical protein